MSDEFDRWFQQLKDVVVGAKIDGMKEYMRHGEHVLDLSLDNGKRLIISSSVVKGSLDIGIL